MTNNILTNENSEECWACDEENFRYESLGELIDSEDLLPGDVVYKGYKGAPNVTSLVDAGDVLEMLSERAYDDFGECAEDFPDVSKEAADELDVLLQGWIKKHCNVNFWMVNNVEKYTIKEDDVA